MTTSLLADSLVRSIQVGSLYALMALGLTLTLAVIRLPNFAHAEFITVGAYAALLLSMRTTVNPLLVLIFAFLVGAVVALLSNWWVFRPLEKRAPSMYTLILASFALGLILRYIVFLLVDRLDLFDKRIAVPVEIWYQNGALTITNIFVWVVSLSIGLVVALSLLLHYTSLGREMRALADNASLARVIGVPVTRVHNLTWILVGGTAGAAGALWGIYTWVNPLMGWLAILSVFAAVVLGGMTSVTGAILGAYIVAFSENTLMQMLNAWFGLDFSFKPAIPFAIIILVLLLRPQGLAGLFEGWSRRSLRSRPASALEAQEVEGA